MTHRVLVVDDDPPTREMFSVALGMKGLEVQAVGDGSGAMELLESGYDPDVILVDWRMPGMNGSCFCSLVTQNEMLRQIPLLVVSATVSDVPCELPTLAKPFDLKQLFLKINQTVGYSLIN